MFRLLNIGGNMKRLALVVVALLVFSTASYAQYGGGVDVGRTITHKDAQLDADEWYATSNTSASEDALELRGYNRMRADYDLTGDSANINLMCSNDSLWVSGDSIAVTTDSWDDFELMGCEDYLFYVESIEGSSKSITVYVTPYNRK